MAAPITKIVSQGSMMEDWENEDGISADIFVVNCINYLYKQFAIFSALSGAQY